MPASPDSEAAYAKIADAVVQRDGTPHLRCGLNPSEANFDTRTPILPSSRQLQESRDLALLQLLSTGIETVGLAELAAGS